MFGRKINSILLVMALVSMVFAGILSLQSESLVENAVAEETRAFEGGDGSNEDPFQISNVDQLQDMSSDLDAHYVLINDIDATSTVDWNTGEGFEPIGDSTHKFTGSLDGQGYEITGLFINRSTTNHVGLIGDIDTDASLEDIGLINIDISGNYQVGGIAGWNDGTISNSYATGSITGTNRDIGGLVGSNEGEISNCTANCNVIGDYFVGGLAGISDEGTISYCSASGMISGTESVGGLVGSSDYDDKISNCYATGNITGSGRMIGGLVGQVYKGPIISDSYSTGSVNGGNDVGGLIGQVFQGTVSNCYATGNIAGGLDLGGLVGYIDNSVATNCFSTGNVHGTGDYVGGLMGNLYQTTVQNCQATGSVRGDEEVGGLMGYLEEGIVSNCSASGNVSGTSGIIGGLVGSNVDATVENCYAIGNIDGYEEVGGLVGSNDGSIQNSSASGNVIGTDICVGGLVGYDSDTISNCYATGNVSGADDVGGLVGYNNIGPVLNSYATGNVIGTNNRIGGLVGENNGMVTNCYSIGNASGVGEIGGLVGYNSGSVSNGFWDTETSGMATSDGGTGKITSEMKQEVTFTGAGWNFADSWSIWEERTYPYLNNITYSSPVIVNMDVTAAIEDQIYDVNYAAESSLPGCADLTWEIDTDATWLTIGAGGILSGTPENEDVGNHSIEVTCSDIGSVPTTRTFILSVINTNDAPEIDITYLNATEDTLYSMPLIAIDIDPTEDILTWALESGPTWLELNTTDNTLNGTPLNSDVGAHEVNVSVDDGNGGSDWQNFTITVENVNDNPIILTMPLGTILQDDLYSVYLNATDEDPVELNLTWSVNTDAEWLELNESYLNGTPANSDVGSYWINMTVQDGYGGSNTLNYTLVVENINDAPVWSLTPEDQNITEGELLSLDCMSMDIDGDNITYSIETTPSSDMTIDSGTGAISWASPSIGSYSVTITATDGSLEVDHTFSIDVYAEGEEPVDETDTDGDGMPDEWEEAHGLDPDDDSDASEDPDGDGITNLDEYKQGSDPNVDGSTGDEKSNIGLYLIVGLVLLLIIVIIIVIMVRSGKNGSDQDEE